jgi:hypothetical protein
MTTIKVLVTLKRLPYLCEGTRFFDLYFSESDVAKMEDTIRIIGLPRANMNVWLTERTDVCVWVCVSVCVCVSSPTVMSHNAQYIWYRNSSRVSACPIARPNPLLCSCILFYFAAFFFPSCSILRKLSTVLGNVICSYLLSWMLIHFLIPGRVCLYKLTNSAMLNLYREFSRTKLRFR